MRASSTLEGTSEPMTHAPKVASVLPLDPEVLRRNPAIDSTSLQAAVALIDALRSYGVIAADEGYTLVSPHDSRLGVSANRPTSRVTACGQGCADEVADAI